MAHVLVLGASQGIGLETTKAALAAGHRVRAFARSAAGIDLADPSLERFTGDALNAGDVAAALDGVDVVVQALGVPARDLIGPVHLFSDATNLLVPAMETAGVRRLIAVTGFGAGDSRDAIGLLQRLPFRLVFGRAYDDKDAQEMRIRRSGLDWTLVRPGVLTPGAATGRYKVLTEPSSWRNGLISRADVAGYIVAQIDRPSQERKAVVLIR
ncbi:NAD(P)-dependent oxidoreductase [Methylobacterium sp. J-077]|uniref:NAD(P)-dependent oxidoreductase n=1 Tax=Methylobacterium sp. J-077 TaxID=2836656 RepID=UPI001FB998B7|nr:NAD(P)H-binding protein [Methylobacterium sp. J-077]MCJ2121479.1 NAD(P)H-binding protein [Methylobacterium sp. J-077]